MYLNEKQQQVIHELDRNILLIASAGTGKTNTLALRTAEIIKENRANASEILCITFTNKACKEMAERIENHIGLTAKKISIKTFHSFCYDIIKEQAKKNTDIFTDFIVFDEEDCKELLGSMLNTSYPFSQIQQFIDLVKLERAKRNIYSFKTNEDYENTIKTLFINSEDRLNNLCKINGVVDEGFKEYLRVNGKNIILQYNNLLLRNHGLDFSDLIVTTKELFLHDALAERIRQRYKYINIDEVQDTSALEYEIIEKLFKNNKILVCGDFFQTIYGWRGSMPQEIFSAYKAKYFPKEIIFDINYRATEMLTKASLSYLKNAFPRELLYLYSENIKAKSLEIGEKITFKENTNIKEEAKYILEVIAKTDSQDILNSTCVLTRDNRYNIELSNNLRELMARDIYPFEFVLVDQFKFFRRQEIKDVIAFLKLIANRYDSLSLKRILKRIPCGIGDKTIETINSKAYLEAGISLTDYIDPLLKEEGVEKYSLLIKELYNKNIVVFDVESTGTDVTEDEIIQIAAIKLDENGNIISSFEKLLKNHKPVGASESIHGFTDEKLQQEGEDKVEVLKSFQKYIQGSIIVGHNVQYDINILSSELMRYNLGKPSFQNFYDTLDIYRRFYPTLRNHKLETLSSIFETVHKPSHDAMDDIIATGELLIRALKKDIIPTALQRSTYMSNHLKSFSFIYEKLEHLFIKAESLRPWELVAEIINSFNLKSIYTSTDGEDKISRLRDFYVLLKELDNTDKNNRDALLDVIKITGLSNGDLENLIINRTRKPRIPIITVHQAKGLEFNRVFLAGAQNNTFPSYISVKTNNMEEEKRTFYVALTRAKGILHITSSKYNKFNRPNDVSPFIKYISKDYIEYK